MLLAPLIICIPQGIKKAQELRPFLISLRDADNKGKLRINLFDKSNK